jgi:murein DD-endopeptidase MepM/ murein hydrolase activator NlpD
LRQRPRLLLSTVVLGAVAAGLWEGGWGLATPIAHAHDAPTASVLVAMDGPMDVAGEWDARPKIAEAEAALRMQELTASRAAREEAARPKAVLPLEGRLTSSYGGRWGGMHYGLDIAAPMMTPEYAAADGVVLRAGPAQGFGLAVYILHDNGDVTVYGHMEEILVDNGQTVRAGDTIALVGNRGQSTGPHLHFEVFEGGLEGRRVDPAAWLRERGVDI